MVKNQEKLKELLRDVLPLLQDFIGEGAIEEEEAFGGVDQELEMDMMDEGYEDDFEMDEGDMGETYDHQLEEKAKGDDKELRKKMSALTISKKLGKDKKRK